MPSEEDSITRIRKRREQEKESALAKLGDLRQQKITLNRPVCFVPGWTDEDCTCWMTPYPGARGRPIREWMPEVATNPKSAQYVTFTEQESKQCRSFLDFAQLLKARIWKEIGKNTPFDAVGHSMGGLDIVAAILDSGEPLPNVQYLITVATPHRGSEFGEFAAAVAPGLRGREKQHHKVQCRNLDPDQPPIKRLNTQKARSTVLTNVYEFYSLMGTRDLPVMRSARYDTTGLDAQLVREKYQSAEIGGAPHSGAEGITQDPRTIFAILRILTDLKLDQPVYNYGYIIRTP